MLPDTPLFHAIRKSDWLEKIDCKIETMNSGQDDFSMDIKLAGEIRQVTLSPYNFGSGKQLKCRMSWDDEPIEFWLHFKTGVWKFKNPAQVPKEISRDAPLFNRTLKSMGK